MEKVLIVKLDFKDAENGTGKEIEMSMENLCAFIERAIEMGWLEAYKKLTEEDGVPGDPVVEYGASIGAEEFNKKRAY